MNGEPMHYTKAIMEFAKRMALNLPFGMKPEVILLWSHPPPAGN